MKNIQVDHYFKQNIPGAVYICGDKRYFVSMGLL